MRIAVFVDAGYLYAQGSIAITRAKKPKSREELSLDTQKLVARIKELTKELAPNKDLLRIYWYDGALPGRLRDSHEELALTDDVKLRLGRLHDDGQQKGVDSLIVTDLIELARNRSITDALLISGDEDVRVGVEIAQTYGIRVHLLGIHPAIDSQSELLRREADTRREWSSAIIANFLKHEPRTKPIPPKEVSPKATAVTNPSTAKAINPQSKPQAAPALPVQEIVERAKEGLDAKLLAKARECLAEGKQIPGQSVTLLYKAAEEILGRKPKPAEKTMLRKRFSDSLTPPR